MTPGKKSWWRSGAGPSPDCDAGVPLTCASFSVTNIVLDSNVVLTPFATPGVAAPWGTLVHSGFQTGWVAVVPALPDA